MPRTLASVSLRLCALDGTRPYGFVLPYYKKIETDLQGTPVAWHARPVRVRRFDYGETIPSHVDFIETAKVLSFPSCTISTNPEEFCAGQLTMNIENGTRLSAALTYLIDEVWSP